MPEPWFVPISERIEETSTGGLADVLPSGLWLEDGEQEKYERALEMLPARWIDILELRAEGKLEREIAAVLDMSQANASVLLRRAIRGVKLLLSLPPITEEGIVRDLSPLFPRDTVAMMRYYYRTSNQVHTTKLLGWPYNRQGRVRHRIEKTIRALEAYGLDDYVRVFRAIWETPNAWADIRQERWGTSGERRDLTPVEFFPLESPPPKVEAVPPIQWVVRRRKPTIDIHVTDSVSTNDRCTVAKHPLRSKTERYREYMRGYMASRRGFGRYVHDRLQVSDAVEVEVIPSFLDVNLSDAIEVREYVEAVPSYVSAKDRQRITARRFYASHPELVRARTTAYRLRQQLHTTD